MTLPTRARTNKKLQFRVKRNTYNLKYITFPPHFLCFDTLYYTFYKSEPFFAVKKYPYPKDPDPQGKRCRIRRVKGAESESLCTIFLIIPDIFSNAS